MKTQMQISISNKNNYFQLKINITLFNFFINFSATHFAHKENCCLSELPHKIIYCKMYSYYANFCGASFQFISSINFHINSSLCLLKSFYVLPCAALSINTTFYINLNLFQKTLQTVLPMS